MPLDTFQKKILAVLMESRNPDSMFAGGGVLQQHAFRMSTDQDIFHTPFSNVVTVANDDVARLRDAGFDVELKQVFEGLMEAQVMSETEGTSRIQWVEAGGTNFFTPVPDSDFGWRLHMADIATGKVLAAAGRRRVRDYVDLALVQKEILPLWHAIWAAPGKDGRWNPISLAEKIARTNQFSTEEMVREVDVVEEISALKIASIVGDAIDEAREIFEKLPLETAGMLFVDEDGVIAMTPEDILSGDRFKPIAPSEGGHWPSGPDIDRIMINRVIEAYGVEGDKLTGEDPSTIANFRATYGNG